MTPEGETAIERRITNLEHRMGGGLPMFWILVLILLIGMFTMPRVRQNGKGQHFLCWQQQLVLPWQLKTGGVVACVAIDHEIKPAKEGQR